MAEISWETVIAPDIFATKGKESWYIEVKRKSKISVFKGVSVLTVGRKEYDDYSKLNDEFGNVYLFFYVAEDENHIPDVYWATVNKMDNNIWSKKQDFYSFRLDIFRKQEI